MQEWLEAADMLLIGIGEELQAQTEGSEAVFQFLSNVLKGKDYFLITLNVDEQIRKYDFETERIVAPCGSYFEFICSNGCQDTIYLPNAEQCVSLEEQIYKQKVVPEINFPLCPCCKSPMQYNVCWEKGYQENSYLPQWDVYSKWVQNTLGKHVHILELGVGMKYPTVIRWPFEKMAYYNQKAEFIRIHSKYAQMPEELRSRGRKFPMTPVEFLLNKIV